jgi:hypothetical protein
MVLPPQRARNQSIAPPFGVCVREVRDTGPPPYLEVDLLTASLLQLSPHAHKKKPPDAQQQQLRTRISGPPRM